MRTSSSSTASANAYLTAESSMQPPMELTVPVTVQNSMLPPTDNTASLTGTLVAKQVSSPGVVGATVLPAGDMPHGQQANSASDAIAGVIEGPAPPSLSYSIFDGFGYGGNVNEDPLQQDANIVRPALPVSFPQQTASDPSDLLLYYPDDIPRDTTAGAGEIDGFLNTLLQQPLSQFGGELSLGDAQRTVRFCAFSYDGKRALIHNGHKCIFWSISEEQTKTKQLAINFIPIYALQSKSKEWLIVAESKDVYLADATITNLTHVHVLQTALNVCASSPHIGSNWTIGDADRLYFVGKDKKYNYQANGIIRDVFTSALQTYVVIESNIFKFDVSVKKGQFVREIPMTNFVKFLPIAGYAWVLVTDKKIFYCKNGTDVVSQAIEQKNSYVTCAASCTDGTIRIGYNNAIAQTIKDQEFLGFSFTNNYTRSITDKYYYTESDILYSIVDHNNRLDYTEILNKVEIACKKATNPLENLLQYEQVLELVTPLNKYKSILRNYDSSVVNDPTRVDTLDQTHTNGYISDVATRATDIAESIINEYPQSGT
jgi:hypothetical protein